MADPVTCVQMHGLIQGADIPAAQSYKNTGFYWQTVASVANGTADLFAHLSFRPSNPTVAVAGLTTLTTLLADPVRTGAAMSTVYDQSANTTTIRFQFGSEFAQIVVPLSLHLLPDLVAQNAWFASNGLAFHGSSAEITVQASDIPAYVFKDGGGKTICAVYASMSIGRTMLFAGMFSSTSGAAFTFSTIQPTGTFSQTNNGQTLSGAFTPFGIVTTSVDASQLPPYWTTH